MEEIRSLVKIYAGVDFGHLDGPKGLPMALPFAGSPRNAGSLHRRLSRGGKARFLPLQRAPGKSAITRITPLTLLTGPVLFHSGSLSAHSPGLPKNPGGEFRGDITRRRPKIWPGEAETAVLESKAGKMRG